MKYVPVRLSSSEFGKQNLTEAPVKKERVQYEPLERSVLKNNLQDKIKPWLLHRYKNEHLLKNLFYSHDLSEPDRCFNSFKEVKRAQNHME